MKLVHLSDNHRMIPPDVEECDILCHSGDLTNIGEIEQVVGIFEWMRRQKAKHVIFIAGNHDRTFDRQFCSDWNRREDYLRVRRLIDDLPNNIYYLENEGVTIDGVNFWGSPVTPDFFPQFWAFNKPRGKEIKAVWEGIPENTNVLITHGPPMGMLDGTITFVRTGCEDLLNKIEKLSQLKLSLFGHIHEANGIVEKDGVTFSNGSILDEKYVYRNEPKIFEI